LQEIQGTGIINYKQLSDVKDYKNLADAQTITKESEQIWARDGGKLGYVQAQHNYSNINGYLRGNIKTLTPDNQKTVATLDKLTTSNSLPDNYIGIRKVKGGYLSDVLGLNNYKDYSQPNAKFTADAIKSMTGQEIEDKAFTSISLLENKNYFKDYPIKFTIKMPKGTQGLVTNNIAESEFIAARGSKLRILDVEIYKPTVKSKNTFINIIVKLVQ
jgi:hypothetical protein